MLEVFYVFATQLHGAMQPKVCEYATTQGIVIGCSANSSVKLFPLCQNTLLTR